MALDARITELRHANEAAYDEAQELLKTWREDWASDEQWTEAIEALPGVGAASASLIRMLAEANHGAVTGVIPMGSRLRGEPWSVAVRRVETGAAQAPGGLAAAASRIPDSDGGSQIRVEKYTMADGAPQYVVYLGGTSTFGDNTFNWPSNLELYFGYTSPSFAATVAALEDAGVKPGDVVHTFAYSQGAMVAARLVTEGDYQVKTYVGFGSPVDAVMGEDTLSMQLRHRDDAISLLSNGGTPAGTGAEGSLVVERMAEPEKTAWWGEVKIPAHKLEAYVDTAAMTDESDDVRVEAFREALERLRADAVSAEFIEYDTEMLSDARDPEVLSGAGTGGVSGSSSSGDGG